MPLVFGGALAIFLATAPLAAPPPPALAASFVKYWGPLWYLRSYEVKDDVTLVYGGVRGCTGLAWQDVDNKRTYWIFLERGDLGQGKMFTSMGTDAPIEQQTVYPGYFIMTEPLTCYTPKDSDHRNLSYLLIDVYNYFLNDPIAPVTNVTHSPFLSGKGWIGHTGASMKEAQEICTALGLTLVVDNGATQGYVLHPQVSSPGALRDLVQPDHSVHVNLDGAVIPPPATPVVGDTWTSPFDLPDPLNLHKADVSVSLTVDFTDNSFDCPMTPLPGFKAGRRDAFYRLPDTARGRMVTVTAQPGSYDRLCLTAWQLGGTTIIPIPSTTATYTASCGLRPKLQFVNGPDATCFVMVENQLRDLADIKLHFEW